MGNNSSTCISLWRSVGGRSLEHEARHLRRVVGVQRLNSEELLTFINQIEAILNSSPSFPMSNDPNDFSPLTPGHFLIGDSMISLPQEDIFINSNQRFNLLQKVYQEFWKSWKRDYLTELQVRKKWFIDGPQLAIGDLVLIAENNEPPLMWKTGRVVKLFEGNDGISRVSRVKDNYREMRQTSSEVTKAPTGSCYQWIRHYYFIESLESLIQNDYQKNNKFKDHYNQLHQKIALCDPFFLSVLLTPSFACKYTPLQHGYESKVFTIVHFDISSFEQRNLHHFSRK